MTSAVSKISNSCSYEGVVRIRLNNSIGNYEYLIHNSGTKHLFDTISKALSGKSIVDALPRYLNLKHGTAESVEAKEPCLIQPVLLTGTVYGEPAEATETDGRLLLNGIITYEDKRAVTNLVNPVMIVEDASHRPLATIQNDSVLNSMWGSIDNGSEALIEWTLIFSSKETGK